MDALNYQFDKIDDEGKMVFKNNSRRMFQENMQVI